MADPLPIYVDIAPGASPTGTPDSWDAYWLDITNDVFVKENVTIEEGIPDEANQADPSTCSLTLNNGVSKVPATAGQIGCYSPRNVAGPHWGKLAKNTPLRVRQIRGRDTFSRVRASGTGLGTADYGISWSSVTNMGTDGTRAVFAPTGTTTATNGGAWDFDLTTAMAINILPGAGNYRVFNFDFRRSANANMYSLRIDFQPDGQMAVYMGRYLETVYTILSSAYAAGITPITVNTKYAVRLKAEAGFVGAKVWLASNPEPANWTVSSSTQGAYTLDTTNLGTIIRIAIGSVGTPATTESYIYPLTITSYPFVGTVPEWPVRWDLSNTVSKAPIKATGVIRSLLAGKSPLRAPLVQFMDSLKPSAVWPLDDESGSTVAASSTSNVRAASIYSTSAAGWNGLPLNGTEDQFSVGQDTTIKGTLPRVTPTGAWLAWFAFYMPVLPVTNPTIFRVRSSGTVTQWDFKVSDSFGGVTYLVGFAPDGTVLVNESITFVPGQWVIGQMEIQQSGSNLTGRIVTYSVTTGAVAGSTSAAVAGNIGAPQGWSIYGSVGFQDGAAGPVAFYPFIPTVDIGALLSGARGFAGETAGARVARLAAQAGIRLDLISGGQSSLMGPQPVDTLINNLGECAVTDLGLLTEYRGGLRYRTRGRRYGQNPRMTLDMALGHLSDPPEPVDDDKALRNDVTVSRRNGSSARAIDAASVAASGRYDTSVDVNTYTDDVLPGQAGLRLLIGTWDELRWPSISINALRNAASAAFLERLVSLEPGAHVQVINPPANLPVGTIRLLVENIRTVLGPYTWDVELTCTPYGPWRMWPNGSANGLLYNRMDLVGSTLGSAEAATAVGATDTWTITNSGRDWSTTAVPYDWVVNGEQVTVTAISGSGTQTATVTRGVGGITKAHVVGEPIHLNTIMYVAH